MPSRKTVLFAFSVLLVALATGFFALSVMRPAPGVLAPVPIGGPFALTDHTGKRVTEKDFLGRHMLVIFGYTFCPDVCPGEMQVVSAALDLIGEEAKQLKPVFISVDPERDTPKAVADFVSNFHPDFTGLTGTEEEVRAVTRAFLVVAAKVENKSRPQDYLVEHTALIYLMDPQGRYKTHFRYSTDAKGLAEEIKAALK